MLSFFEFWRWRIYINHFLLLCPNTFAKRLRKLSGLICAQSEKVSPAGPDHSAGLLVARVPQPVWRFTRIRAGSDALGRSLQVTTGPEDFKTGSNLF